MSTPTTISNMALDHIGEKRIASIDDNNNRAQKCKAWYPIARDAMLEEHKFGFAEKRKSLALVSDAVYDPEDTTGYEYAYAYPSDCLVAEKIYNSSSSKPSDKEPFVLQTNSTLTAVYILTNAASAILVYTGATESFTAMRSKLLQLAISHKLASLIAMPLTKDPKLRDDNINMAFAIGGQAKTKDSNEQHEESEDFDDYIDPTQ
jgi:hypothetical protein